MWNGNIFLDFVILVPFLWTQMVPLVDREKLILPEHLASQWCPRFCSNILFYLYCFAVVLFCARMFTSVLWFILCNIHFWFYGFLSHNRSLLTRDCYMIYLLLMNNVLEQLANHDTSRRFDISRQRQIVLSIFSLVKVRSLKFMHDWLRTRTTTVIKR